VSTKVVSIASSVASKEVSISSNEMLVRV
jgi:hypothetical protein